LSHSNPPNLGIIIPARINSSRLERKLLIDIHGLPMIEHVRRRALLNNLNLPVVVASGDIEILKVVEEFGGNTLHTPGNHENGLSRVGEASQDLKWDRYIVLQGDEILTRPKDLDVFIQQNVLPESHSVVNAITKLNTSSEIHDDSVVKCLISNEERIIYIFRKSPLVSQDSLQMQSIRKICGLFAITHEILQNVLSQPNTRIAQHESIEQLKFIELGIGLGSVHFEKDYPSVNLLKDLQLVHEVLAVDAHQREILQSIL
jgi:3-deoxy-manno-octulosonate cytidylyltransferase (CMP-KDO synthetase)